MRDNTRKMIRDALKKSSNLPKPPIDSMFDDVYDMDCKHINEQREELRTHIKKYPEQYNVSQFLNGEKWIK